MFRYWTGTHWSAFVTSDPSTPPPSAAIGEPGSHPVAGTAGPSQPSSQPIGGTNGSVTTTRTRRRSRPAVWIGAAAVLLVVVVVAAFGIRSLVRHAEITIGETGGDPGSDVCPPQPTDYPSPPPQKGDGRVYAGSISYPALGAPFGPPTSEEDRVPFADQVMEQTYVVEPNYDGTNSWVASVLIGDLTAGDGFFSPEQGSKIVVKCIQGAFYGNNPVTVKVVKNAAATVDGQQAWYYEAHLSFDIPNLKTKGETMIVEIVATSATDSGIFYASIPDTTPQLLQPARDALKQLRVD